MSEELGVGIGVIHKRGEKHSAIGGQRAARPPEMQRGGVDKANGFFARGLGVDILHRQCDFNEFLAVWGHLFLRDVGFFAADRRAARSLCLAVLDEVYLIVQQPAAQLEQLRNQTFGQDAFDAGFRGDVFQFGQGVLPNF